MAGTASAIGTLAAVAASVTVAIVEAVRAHKARREHDELLKAQQNAEHRRAASLVSAWVEETYVPSADGRAYWRVVIVHIANEGDQPVFQASVTIGAGGPTRTIGPLSVPNRIPVLPPRRELIWDIILPLLVHQNTEQPCAEVSFVDPAGREWVRRFDGTLEEITGQPATLVEIADEQAMIEQLGDLNELYNPMTVALALLNAVQAEQFDRAEFEATLAPEAPGWQNLSSADIENLRAELATYGFGSMPSYPTPHVSYVKIIPERTSGAAVVQGARGVQLPAKILTLTFAHDRGWRVFGVGYPVPPDRILFPPGTLLPPAASDPNPAEGRRRRRRDQL